MHSNMIRNIGKFATLIAIAGVIAGCPYTPAPGGGGTLPPTGNTLYDQGFDEGFLRDDWYWQGFWDSFDTKDFEPLYYQGSDIPNPADGSYDAGFYDGIWYAYNDGYFTDYRYAFILGFSEGYDAAFYPDFLTFLANDLHIENLNGGWGDGYNDGFSEGRIFGAADYEDGRPFDWLDALLDYEAGTDLYFAEIDLGTGLYGPVYLYEYGVDPITLKAATGSRQTERMRSVRGLEKGVGDLDLFRPLTNEAASELDVVVENVPRSGNTVRYEGTRLDRLELYLSGATTATKAGDGDRSSRSDSPRAAGQ